MEPAGGQPTGGESFWLATSPGTNYPALRSDVDVDAAVIGAGIVGILAAFLLKREGRSVALLDSKRIVRGATGYTTAKLTSGHGLIYAELAERFGKAGAQIYADSNQVAVEWVADLAQELEIECDLERRPNYVYATHEDELDRLRSEVAAMQELELPASLQAETPLPFPVAGAIRLENQAQFHPRKFLLPVAATLPGDGSHVYENTIATRVDEGDPCVIETDGGRVRARDVVVATQLPFLDRGLYFAKAHPHRSYAVAAPLESEQAPEGMFINAGVPTRSVRTLVNGTRTLLQVGGHGHFTGDEPDTPGRYRTLERFLHEHWPGAGEIEHRWSTQDYLSVDRVPFVGRLNRRSKHVRVATGFSKWGMSNGVVAAILLADAILGRDNPWATLYDSTRVKPRAALKRFVTWNATAGRHFIADRLRGVPPGSPEDLRPGEGALLRVGGRKRACYRDAAGVLHVLSPICPHLHCLVGWNPAEGTWDCPCHGSRFTGVGTLIQGPSVHDLRRRSL